MGRIKEEERIGKYLKRTVKYMKNGEEKRGIIFFHQILLMCPWEKKQTKIGHTTRTHERTQSCPSVASITIKHQKLFMYLMKVEVET